MECITMGQLNIIDIFDSFLAFWETVKDNQMDEQIDSWFSMYLGDWPDLRQQLQQSYEEDQLDWREIAKKHVFPFLDSRLPEMKLAHGNLIQSIEPIYYKAQEVLGLDFDVIFLIYVGIGIGAGWATTFREKRACLLGLENIAECHWTDVATLSGLVAHELGHLLHFEWRERNGLRSKHTSPYWQLYEEGFAQRCEHLIMGRDSWHQEQGENWYNWCAEHKAWLANEFMKTINVEKPVYKFFGSWFDLEGSKHTGYYLGHEIIKELEKTSDLTKIAILPFEKIEKLVRKILVLW